MSGRPPTPETNTVLARRTRVREFDFDLDGEHHRMGELLEERKRRADDSPRAQASQIYMTGRDEVLVLV